MDDLSWQPMETAPRDGTQVFLCWNGRVVVGHYIDKKHFNYGKETYSRQAWTYDGISTAELFGGDTTSQPTHWLVIPEVAPAEARVA